MPNDSKQNTDIAAQLRRRMADGCRQFSLLENGDRILVAVSGGKDSLALLDLLAQRQRIRVPELHIEAVHVRMREVEYESDTAYLERFAEQRGVTLHIMSTSFTDTGSSRKPPCFLCSWARRKVLFELAQKLDCNKLALGHHQDDIIHTALMNLTFQGQFATMPASLKLQKMPLTIIRPLCYVPEQLIAEWAQQQAYQVQTKHCPHEHATNRTAIKSVFDQMQTLSAEARNSIWNALLSADKLCM